MSLLLIQQSAVLFWSTSIRARCCFQISLDFSSLSPEPVSPSARAERSPQRRSAAGLHVRNGRAAPRAEPRVARLARLERRALRRDLLTDRREVLQVDREIGELRFRKRVALHRRAQRLAVLVFAVANRDFDVVLIPRADAGRFVWGDVGVETRASIADVVARRTSARR